MRKPLSSLLLIASLVFASGCGGGSGAGNALSVGYVTNGISPFWVIAEKGARDGGRDFQVDVQVLMPPEGTSDQKRMIQDLLARGVDGIAVSPIDPENQGDILNEIAANTHYITQDSDAPKTDRLMYIGMDNYTAGRMSGQLVKEALPDGGDVMIFVGRLGQLNADLRRQGVIDELLDRSHDPDRRDPNEGVIDGGKYRILDTRTDQFDFARAKSQAEDAIAKYPDLDAMVGLFGYNPPKCLEAIKEAGKTGQIKVIAFDEEDDTLQGIKDGLIQGTVVQNPYRYGYESVRVLAALARGDRSVLTDDKFLDIPARTIRQDNVDAYWAELKELTAE
ncbi:MAG: sugar-binding protein [Rhodothermales bacterium]|nr:sugar-binding protein [Rhodothermales bacterium]